MFFEWIILMCFEVFVVYCEVVFVCQVQLMKFIGVFGWFEQFVVEFVGLQVIECLCVVCVLIIVFVGDYGIVVQGVLVYL